MSKKGVSFCVIGSGIIGMSSAYCIAKRFKGCRVTVVFADSSPRTTSNHGFGICSLPDRNNLDGKDTPRWTKMTGNYLREVLHKSPHSAAEMGITAVKSYFAYHKQSLKDDPDSAPVLDTFSFHRELSESEIDTLGYRENDLDRVFERPGVKKRDLTVYEAGTWTLDNHAYLPWLKKEMELMEARGEISSLQFVKKKISNFSDVIDGDCDFIVNCSGLGSEYLVPDDKVLPVRGQYLITERKEDIELRVGLHTFVCPKIGRVALGSVYQRGRRDTAIDPIDTEDILRRCYALNPKIANWKIIKEDVGIRPGRYGGPRVGLELRSMASGTKVVPVIHNYGHGARGIMQHWGCAQDVVKFAEKALKLNSKL